MSQLTLWCEGRHKNAVAATHVIAIHGTFTRSFCGDCAAQAVVRGIAKLVTPIEACNASRRHIFGTSTLF